MTKAQLVEQVADAIGPGVTKRDCALVVDGFLNAVKRALAEGDSIELRGFGSFKVREQKARKARNPRTGEPVQVPARSVPSFKPSKLWRDRIENGPPPPELPPTPRYTDPAFVSFPAPGPDATFPATGAGAAFPDPGTGTAFPDPGPGVESRRLSRDD